MYRTIFSHQLLLYISLFSKVLEGNGTATGGCCGFYHGGLNFCSHSTLIYRIYNNSGQIREEWTMLAYVWQPTLLDSGLHARKLKCQTLSVTLGDAWLLHTMYNYIRTCHVNGLGILAYKWLWYKEGLGTPSGTMVWCVITEVVWEGQRVSAEMDTVLWLYTGATGTEYEWPPTPLDVLQVRGSKAGSGYWHYGISASDLRRV